MIGGFWRHWLLKLMNRSWFWNIFVYWFFEIRKTSSKSMKHLSIQNNYWKIWSKPVSKLLQLPLSVNLSAGISEIQTGVLSDAKEYVDGHFGDDLLSRKWGQTQQKSIDKRRMEFQRVKQLGLFKNLVFC